MVDADIWEEIVACRRRGDAAALATIVSTLGSTPGKMPMKMLVRGDGTFVGSVGGGCLEAEVWEHARTVMKTMRPMTCEFSLDDRDDPENGLICGGKVTVFIEPVTMPSVHVFGAGHVGRATANLAAECGFRVSVYDDREDMLDAGRFHPAVTRIAGPFETTAAAAELGDRSFVICVTRGHDEDGRVLRCLAHLEKRPYFLGMVGSKAKRATLLAHLEDEGVERRWLDAIVSPVGLSIGARTAPEIAVSIVAQIVSDCRGGGMGGEADRKAAAAGAAEAAESRPPAPREPAPPAAPQRER